MPVIIKVCALEHNVSSIDEAFDVASDIADNQLYYESDGFIQFIGRDVVEQIVDDDLQYVEVYIFHAHYSNYDKADLQEKVMSYEEYIADESYLQDEGM